MKISNLLRITRVLLPVLMLVGILFSTFDVLQAAQAEGSVNTFPSSYPNQTNTRPDTEWRITQTAGLYRRTFFRVYANAGEYILMGSSAMGLTKAWGTAPTTTAGDIVLYTEGQISNSQIDASYVDTGSANTITPTFKCSSVGGNAGVLRGPYGAATSAGTRTMELQGATRNGGTDGGYIPCVYQAPTTGSYWVAMSGPDGSTVHNDEDGTGGTIAAPNITTSQNSGVSAWDITVRSGDPNTGTNKPGRVYVDYLAQHMGGNGTVDQLFSTIYAVTTDGFVYKIDTNGLDPDGYIFYGNRVGFLDPDGKTPLYNDFTTGNNLLTPITGGVIQAPASAKIFFSNPLLSDLPASLLPTPVTPSITDITYQGSAYNNTGYQPVGGTFTYSGNVGGITEIVISQDKVNFDPTLPTNRRLLAQSFLGANTLYWDGKDNSGNPFPVGTNYPFQVTFHAGEYHFPMLDSENSIYGGPIFTMLNPVGGVCPFNVNCHTAFYDDRGYRLSTGTVIGTVNATLPGDANATNPPATNFSNWTTGFDTSTTQRAYGGLDGNGFGNWKGLNLWTYYPVQAVQNYLNVITQVPQDLAIVKNSQRCVYPWQQRRQF